MEIGRKKDYALVVLYMRQKMASTLGLQPKSFGKKSVMKSDTLSRILADMCAPGGF